MSSVYLAYPLTSEAERAVFVHTGKRPETIQANTYTLPYTLLTQDEFMALSEEDRQLIASLGSFLPAPRAGEFVAQLPEQVEFYHDKYDGPKFRRGRAGYGHPLSVAEWLTAAAKLIANNKRAAATFDTERRAWLQERIADAVAKINADQSSGLWGVLRMEAERMGLDLSAHDAAIAAAEARKAAVVAANRAEADARNAAEELMRELAEQSKAQWIEAHGSDHLKRACARGHDCQRMYVVERAALELPGYTVDFEDNSEWKSRPCPSKRALDEADRVERLDLRPADEIEVLIVWLTDPARAERLEEWGIPEEFEECEAVVVRGYLGKYDVIKEM